MGFRRISFAVWALGFLISAARGYAQSGNAGSIWSLRFTVSNLTNKEALYNFLSTFSGTHFMSPRSETVELGVHF